MFQAFALAHGSFAGPAAASVVAPFRVAVKREALPPTPQLGRVGLGGVADGRAGGFVLIGQPQEGHNRPPIPAWTLAMVITVPLVTGSCSA